MKSVEVLVHLRSTDETAYGLVQTTYQDSDRPSPLRGMMWSMMNGSLIVTQPIMETLNYFNRVIYLMKLL